MNNLILKIFFLFYFLSGGICFSQPHTEWVQRYNSPGNFNDYVTDMAVDKSGNVYLTGYVSVNDTDQNIVTIKYNTQGIEQWVKYYDGQDHREDKPVAVAVDDSGNVIVSGSSYSSNSSFDFLTIKYNPNGDSLWNRRFTNGLIASAMTLDNIGNILVTGGTLGGDILTIKYDRDGNLNWTKYYNGIANEYDVSYCLFVDKQNITYVGGGVTGKGGIIIKYDSDGNQFQPFIFTQFAPNRKIIIDNNFNILLGFDWYGGLTTRYDIGVAKIDSNGIINWIRNYHNNSTNNSDYIRDMCMDKFGNVSATGVSANTGQQGWDIATIKYNSNGDTLWINRYNPALNSNDEPSGIASDKYGNTYVTGTSDSGFFGKMITIKYSPIGIKDWTAYYNNNNIFTSHAGAKIIADSSGNLYVAGRSQNNSGNIDIVLIKYSILTNIEVNSSAFIDQFQLYQNYPNPFNPKTTISYELPVLSNVSLKVFNNLGKEIYTLVNEKQNQGLHKVEFDGSNFSSGIYYYSLLANNKIINTKKLILLK